MCATPTFQFYIWNDGNTWRNTSFGLTLSPFGFYSSFIHSCWTLNHCHKSESLGSPCAYALWKDFGVWKSGLAWNSCGAVVSADHTQAVTRNWGKGALPHDYLLLGASCHWEGMCPCPKCSRPVKEYKLWSRSKCLCRHRHWTSWIHTCLGFAEATVLGLYLILDIPEFYSWLSYSLASTRGSLDNWLSPVKLASLWTGECFVC